MDRKRIVYLIKKSSESQPNYREISLKDLEAGDLFNLYEPNMEFIGTFFAKFDAYKKNGSWMVEIEDGEPIK